MSDASLASPRNARAATGSPGSAPDTNAEGHSLSGQRIHFIGIGGCGMSGLASVAQDSGAVCTGSDLAAGVTTEMLIQRGIEVRLEQTADSLPDGCDLVVISAAISADHPEVLAARNRGIEVIKYAQMLGRLMQRRYGIAIAGTHGKSSTTSMLAHILIEVGLDPSVIVGANCPQIGGGARSGRGRIMLAEACEFDRSFHHLKPMEAAILNVEADHLDIYGSLDEIIEAFADFARLIPSDGQLLIQHESPHRLPITAGLDCQVQTVGFAPQADWRIQWKFPVARLYRDGELICGWTSPMPGEHMAFNAAVAAILAHRQGAAWPAITSAIETFRGLDRRMQMLGQRRMDGDGDEPEVTVVDDYGHHPTEIDTTLRALRHWWNPRRIICVFQPHQHSRTRFLMEEFAASFSEADIVIVPHIFFVRDSEKECQAVTAGDLVDRLRKRNVTAMHVYPFEAIIEQLELTLRPGDLLVTMGAGDVWRVARGFLSRRPELLSASSQRPLP
ncbi:MAG: UDP-N-acetylmuramate--L-alanine ligase [Phycisphaeraceae bacterium]|nr:UDP-N-acetylmuramate--L-alanine ligase [Phycisphaeraceae bacterium]